MTIEKRDTEVINVELCAHCNLVPALHSLMPYSWNSLCAGCFAEWQAVLSKLEKTERTAEDNS